MSQGIETRTDVFSDPDYLIRVISVYLTCHAGGPWIKDRQGTRTEYIDDVYLNIFGGFQPGVVRDVLTNAIEDGMPARFGLLVWPDIPRDFEYVDRESDPLVLLQLDGLAGRLRKLDPENFG